MRRIFRSAFAHPCRRSLTDTREPVKSHFSSFETRTIEFALRLRDARSSEENDGPPSRRTARSALRAWQIGIGLWSATPAGKVLGDVRVDGDRLGDVRLAALGIALLDFRDPAAKERLGPLGLEPQCSVVVDDCKIVVPAVAVGDGAAVEGRGELGIETQRLRIIGKRALGVALRGIGEPPIREMSAVSRSEPHRFRVIGDCAIVVAFVPVRVRPLKEGQVVGGTELRCLIVVGDRAVELAEPGERVAAMQIEQALIRLELDRLLVIPRRLRKIVLAPDTQLRATGTCGSSWD